MSSPLDSVDLVALGARTGLLWRSPDVVLAGVGSIEELSVDLSADVTTVQSQLTAMSGVDNVELPGTGPVGFAALPFDSSLPGRAHIPEVVLGECEGVRFVTVISSDVDETAPDADKTALDAAGTALDAAGTALDAAVIAHAQLRIDEALGRKLAERPDEVRLELGRSAESWRDDVVAVARDTIAGSDLEKAVFARALTLHASSDFEPARIVAGLASRFATALVFSIDGFVGASPELLVSRRDRTVRAHPLAGTATRVDDQAADAAAIEALRGSSKDRVEHRITIDWLLAELLNFSSYVDAEPEPSIVTLENVHHLGTRVQGVLSEPPASILELVQAVHPTPAVGGNPQSDAVALISELEGFDRQRYAGPAGWFDGQGNGQFAVSVRTAQIDGPTARIAAGVGVVAQSDPQAELEETQAKFRAMLGTFL